MKLSKTQVFGFFVSFAAANFCDEHTCKICDRIVVESKYKYDANSVPKLCNLILKLDHCCIRFMASNNGLGPVRQEKVVEKERSDSNNGFSAAIAMVVVCTISAVLAFLLSRGRPVNQRNRIQMVHQKHILHIRSVASTESREYRKLQN